MRKAPAALAVTTALVVPVVLAGPAAADHVVTISPDGCSAGVFTFDVYGDVSTRSPNHVTITERPDGSVVATCIFRGIPKQRAYEDFPEWETWTRPAPGTVQDVTGCVIWDDDPVAGYEEWYGQGIVTWGPGGNATTTCEFDPSYFQG